MLRIIVEIVPGGVGRPRELARAELGNVSDLADKSDYVIRASEGVNPLVPAPAWEARGRLTAHNRNQSVWALVAKAAEFSVEAGKCGRGRQVAAAGGRIALPVDGLTDEEIELITNSGDPARSRRAAAARDAIANARLEGLEITPETQAIVDRYIAGEITIEQGLAAVLKRTVP